MAVIPTLGLYIEERFGLHGAELQTWTGRIYAAAPLTAALLGPVWGAVGDRSGRKPMVLRASLGVAVATALMPQATTPLGLLGLRVLQGAFAGYIAPAMVLGSADAPMERQGVVLGRLQLAMAMGLLIGPAVGGQVAYAFGRGGVFYLATALALLGMVPVAVFAHEPRRDALPAGGAPVGRFLGDLGGLLREPCFTPLLAALFLLRFGQHMVEPYVALWVQDLGALPLLLQLTGGRAALALEWTIAGAFAVLAVAQLLFTVRWGRLADRIGPLRCLAAVGLGLGVVFFCTAAVTTTAAFLVLRTAAAVLMAGSMTLAYTAVARRVDAAHKSLAFSLVQSCLQLGLSLGPVLGDALASGAGMSGLYCMGGACLVAAGVGMMVLRAWYPPRLDRTETD